MKNKSILVSLLSMAVMFFAACGDSSNDPVDPNPGGGNEGGGTETIVTAAQAKQSLDRTSQELLSKISANEFEEYKQMLDVDVSDKAGVIQDWFEACVEACEIKANANSTSKCKITKCFCKSTPLVLRNSISFLVSH